MSNPVLDAMRILVVDDDRIMREILRRMLDQGGIRDVVAAAGGEDALALLTGPERAPDLILCDLRMKGMDGLEFCGKVRRNETAPWRDVPILILTAERTALVHDVARQVGATLVMTKPVSTKILLQAIGRTLGFDPGAPTLEQSSRWRNRIAPAAVPSRT